MASTTLLGVALALAAPGDLDPSFSGSGLLSLHIGDFGNAIAVVQQGDGKLVLAGCAVFPPAACDLVAVRVDKSGTRDSTFGTNGVARADFSGFEDIALDVIQQTDGKLVLAGTTETDRGQQDIALARFNTDGTLDATFGNGGLVTLDIDSSHDYARGVIQQPSGKLVVAGEAIVGGQQYQFVFARFNTDGSLDTTFGTDGTTIVNFGGGSESGAKDLAQQSDGKLVAAGTVYSADRLDVDFGITRVTANGALDPSFDADGRLTVDMGGDVDAAYAVAIQPDDAIVAAGCSVPLGRNTCSAAMLRVNGDGSLDDSFGTAGKAVVDLGDGYLSSIVVGQDGKLVATGTRSRIDGARDMILARFNSNGTLDTTYGIDGVATADFGTGDTAPDSSGSALIQQADGRYVAVGWNGLGSFGAARFDGAAAFPGIIGFTRTSRSTDETAAAVTYTVRRTGGTTGAVSVNYATTAGSAQPGSDFQAASGTLNWADGDAEERTLTVILINDTTPEADEEFSLTLSDTTGDAQLAATRATTTIASEDGPGQLEFVSASDVLQVIEGFFDESVGYTVRVRRTGGSTGTVSVSYRTIDGTAEAGTDFNATSGTLTWAAGETGIKSIRIVINPDSAPEGDEEFRIRLSNPTGGATIAPSGGIQLVRILDNDLGIGFSNTRVTVDEAGRSVVLRVTRTDSASGAVSVNYATSPGSATPGSDFTSTSGTLTWPDGDLSDRTITVNITNDSADESNETFVVALSAPAGGVTLRNSRATVTIVDDDPPSSILQFAAIAARLTEGGSLVLGVTRTGPTTGAVSVDFATAPGTATAGTDFTSVNGTLHWADGDSSTQTITVNTTEDTIDEGDETLTVGLSNPSAGAILGPNSTVPVTIEDDDPSGGGGGDQRFEFLTIAATVSEGGSTALSVARIGPASGTVSVDFATSSGSATAGSDYTSASGTLHWVDGDSADKSITVNSIDDTNDEGVETFALTLSNASGAAVGSNSTATVTITDNDPPPPPPDVDGGSGGGGGGVLDWFAVLALTCFGVGTRFRERLI